MPTWNDIKKTVSSFAEKTATKTRELTDTASLKIKIASREADRDTEYKRLGKLTYKKLKNTDENYSETLTVEISKSIEQLDEINAQLAELKAVEKARREAKEAERAADSKESANADRDE